jgi:predicted DNA-binding antitoxin AbrB/MazE fold protein
MIQSIEAVFQDGVFRPIEPPPQDLLEGQRVQVVAKKLSPDEMMNLVTSIYDGLSEEEIDEIERIALDRSNFSLGRQP